MKITYVCSVGIDLGTGCVNSYGNFGSGCQQIIIEPSSFVTIFSSRYGVELLTPR